MPLLEGKLGIVFGVANKRSIAWAIAQAWAREGAKLAFTYQGDRVKENVAELAGAFGADTLILPCDVTKDEEIAGVFKTVGEKFGKLHLLLHSVAFAPKDALEGEFVNTSREAFRIAHDVSAYSLVALARAAAPLMTDGGSIVGHELLRRGKSRAALQRHGRGQGRARSQHALSRLRSRPEKNPRQLHQRRPGQHAGRARHRGFNEMLKHYEVHAPLKRNVLPDELGATGVFLASDGAAAITGQVIYVDCGYQIMGM